MSKIVTKGFYAMVAMEAAALSDIFNNTNVNAVYSVNNILQSWVPGREINNFDNLVKGDGYYVSVRSEIDLTGVFAGVTDISSGSAIGVHNLSQHTVKAQAIINGEFFNQNLNSGDFFDGSILGDADPVSFLALDLNKYAVVILNIEDNTIVRNITIADVDTDGVIVGFVGTDPVVGFGTGNVCFIADAPYPTPESGFFAIVNDSDLPSPTLQLYTDAGRTTPVGDPLNIPSRNYGNAQYLHLKNEDVAGYYAHIVLPVGYFVFEHLFNIGDVDNTLTYSGTNGGTFGYLTGFITPSQVKMARIFKL